MAAKTNFRGSFTALVTPFKNGSIDEAAFRGLVSWQIEQGSHGLVPVGTTGESPTLSHDEHHRVVELCLDEAKGRVPVIAGAGSNSTREAVDLAVHAEKAGADAVLVVTPYYNKPTQEGMYQHFKAVNDAIGIPIIIYNIPPRSVVDMSVETMTRLFELKNIAGVKDATANLARVSQQRHAMGPDFIQLSGEDMTALAYMAAGGHGCISVVANVAPKLCAELMSAVLKGDYATGLKIQDRLDAAARCHLQGAGPRRSQAWPQAAGAAGRGSAPAADDGDAANRQGHPRRHGACRPDQLSLRRCRQQVWPPESARHELPVREAEEKGLQMLKEFREFAMKGNVVDLAVGVIIGAAFGGIVTSLVGDIIMPIIGAITGGLDFSNYFTGLSKAVTAGNLADAKKQGAVLAWGNFLTLTLNFIIIAFVLFLVIRFMNQLKRKDEAAPRRRSRPARKSC